MCIYIKLHAVPMKHQKKKRKAIGFEEISMLVSLEYLLFHEVD